MEPASLWTWLPPQPTVLLRLMHLSWVLPLGTRDSSVGPASFSVAQHHDCETDEEARHEPRNKVLSREVSQSHACQITNH